MRVLQVTLFWAAYAIILFVASYPRMLVPERWGSLVWGTISSGAILGLTLFFLKRERRGVEEIGLDVQVGSVGRFLAGVGFGLVVYGIMILAISLLAGPIRFTRAATPNAAGVLLVVFTFLALSAMEELAFRGYPLRTLVPPLGHWPAQAVVAVAFGLSHLMFGWPWQTVAFGVLPNAVLFGVVAVVSGGLAMPIGLHAAVNIGRWATGETETAGIWQMTIDAPARSILAWLPSLIGVAVMALASAGAWWWYRRRLALSPGGTPGK